MCEVGHKGASKLVGPNGAVDYSHGWIAAEPVGPIVNCLTCPGGAEETSAPIRLVEHVPLVELDVVGVEHAQQFRLEVFRPVVLGLPRDVILHGLLLRLADRENAVSLMPAALLRPFGARRKMTNPFHGFRAGRLRRAVSTPVATLRRPVGALKAEPAVALSVCGQGRGDERGPAGVSFGSQVSLRLPRRQRSVHPQLLPNNHSSP